MKIVRVLGLGVLLAAIGSLALAGEGVPKLKPDENCPRKAPANFKEKDLIASLITALKDKDAAVRENVSNALQALGDKAMPALIEALKDKDTVLRITGATLLGKMESAKKNKAALAALVKLLKDKEVDVRRAASLAIVQIVTPSGNTGTSGPTSGNWDSTNP